MSILDRLRKNQSLEFTTPTFTTSTTDNRETAYSVVNVVNVGVVNPESENFDFSENQQPAEAVKAAALATGTLWRPEEKRTFFLRDAVPNASMDEVYRSYWLAVYHFGMHPGTTPEAAMRYAVNDCRRRRRER